MLAGRRAVITGSRAAAAAVVPVRFARVDSKYDADGKLFYHAHDARNTEGKRAQQPRRQFLAQRVMETVVNPEVVMIAQYNALTSTDWTSVRSKISALGYNVQIVPNIVAKRVLEQTKFANLAPLFWSSTCIVSGSDPANMGKVMSLLKSPRFELVGGKIGSKLLSVDGLSHAATLPSLDVMRATALALLSSPSQRVHSMLNANQSDLLGALTRHAKPPSDNNSEGSKD